MSGFKPITEKHVLKYGNFHLTNFSARQGIVSFVELSELLSALAGLKEEIERESRRQNNELWHPSKIKTEIALKTIDKWFPLDAAKRKEVVP
jgi:hypothetical protein